jgi:hypothetical protein
VQAVSAQCEFLKADGQRCQGRARPGEALCTFHAPSQARQQRQARRAGGRARLRAAAVLADLPDSTPLSTVPEVSALLATVARKTARGELDAKVANSVTQTCAVLLRTMGPDAEVEELKRRLAAVEGQVDVFARVEQFADALRRLRGDGGAGDGGATDGGKAGVPGGVVPRVRLGELLAAPGADGPAGGVPVPDVR